jgi:HAMP domain-containing protein
MRYLRVASICATIVLALFSVQLITGSAVSDKTVYAQVPNASPTLTLVATPMATSTPIVPLQQPAPGVAAPEQAVAQIATLSQQVAQTVHDPTLSTDAKVQQVNVLAQQFNQLVAQWQQQAALTTAAAAPVGMQPPTVAGVQATPMPFGMPQTQPPSVPPTTAPPPTGGTAADQLRAQIGVVTQQMAQVSQDPSLTPEARTTQLKALGKQFNQLMQQLQQLGG